MGTLDVRFVFSVGCFVKASLPRRLEEFMEESVGGLKVSLRKVSMILILIVSNALYLSCLCILSFGLVVGYLRQALGALRV